MSFFRNLLHASVLGLPMLSSPASAESFMFSYNTLLSPVDAFNSRGEPLEGWCALLKQDRANFHRFNKRDADDEADPFFNTSERRALMSGKCEVDPRAFKDPGAQIRSGNREFYLNVRVYGDGTRVTQITTADAF
ncbi:MAG: hypothetical protein AAFR90_11265 [Pseudomonadota bacterium]